MKTNNFFKDLECFTHHFTFNDSNNNHPLYDQTVSKNIGKLEVETSPIIELRNFIALRSKFFSFSKDDNMVRSFKK